MEDTGLEWGLYRTHTMRRRGISSRTGRSFQRQLIDYGPSQVLFQPLGQQEPVICAPEWRRFNCQAANLMSHRSGDNPLSLTAIKDPFAPPFQCCSGANEPCCVNGGGTSSKLVIGRETME